MITKSTLCPCMAIYWDVTALLHPQMWYALATLLDVKALATVVLPARPKVLLSEVLRCYQW